MRAPTVIDHDPTTMMNRPLFSRNHNTSSLPNINMRKERKKIDYGAVLPVLQLKKESRAAQKPFMKNDMPANIYTG